MSKDALTWAAELLASEVYEEPAVTEVIRPAAVLPEDAAYAVLTELSHCDVNADGYWEASPTIWRRYDRPFAAPGQPGDACLVGSIQVIYGSPSKYQITIYRATVTRFGEAEGWDVTALCDDALAYAGLSLATCPRANLGPPPKPYRF